MKVGEVARHFRVSESGAASVTHLYTPRGLGARLRQRGRSWRCDTSDATRPMLSPMFEVRGLRSVADAPLRRPSYPASSRRRNS
jgi:hypothetical protein